MSVFEKEMTNESIMLLIGIIIFSVWALARGWVWAINTLVSLFMAVTLYDWIRKLLNRVEMKGRKEQ